MSEMPLMPADGDAHATCGSRELANEHRQLLEATLGVPFAEGNRVRVLKNGVEIFPPMLAAIAAARESVALLTFVYWKGAIADRFAEALAERARAGVKVHVILDAIGAKQMQKTLVRRMERAGVEIVWFRPPARWKLWQVDNRTHRKVLICDGEVAFTGGVGIAGEWEGDARGPDEWRDTHFEIRGPSVHGLQAAFLDNWIEAGQPVSDGLGRLKPLEPIGDARVQVLRSSASVNWSNVATMFRVLLAMARHRVRLATAYFVPGDSGVDALVGAARRGVDVEILVPGPHHDQRVAQVADDHKYVPLLEAGVRMFAYQPTMMHAKIVIIDDVVAVIGSANFNQRSMSNDDELTLLVIDETVVSELVRHFDGDLAVSTELDAEEYRQRSVLKKIRSRAVGLFSHEM